MMAAEVAPLWIGFRGLELAPAHGGAVRCTDHQHPAGWQDPCGLAQCGAWIGYLGQYIQQAQHVRNKLKVQSHEVMGDGAHSSLRDLFDPGGIDFHAHSAVSEVQRGHQQ